MGIFSFCGIRMQNAGCEKQFGIAHVAQSVEHVLGKDEVISSILIMGSSILSKT